MSSSPGSLRDNLRRVRDRIDAACHRSGRDPSGVTLIAVTKSTTDGDVEALLDLGVRDFGESRAIEGSARATRYAREDVRWHFLGHLQTNKSAKVVAAFQWIHSLDRVSLAEDLEKKCAARNRRLPLFVQVNVSGEVTKGGFRAEEIPRVLSVMHLDFTRLAIRGLMTMAPSGPPETARPYFRRLRILSELHPSPLLLSMGMSNDFEIAIEEGATHIRVGTALFG